MNSMTKATLEGVATAKPGSGEIRLVDVTKQFGNAYAVRNINLTIPHGSYCCLLGPSGCGKTTILRMIAGHETPTSGEIYIGDQMVVGKAPVERGNAPALQPRTLQLQVLQHAALHERLARERQAQRGDVPPQQLGPGSQRQHEPVLGAAAAVVDRFEREPFQPGALCHRAIFALLVQGH